MSSNKKKAGRAAARARARKTGVPVMSTTKLAEGQINLSRGIQESFHRIKTLEQEIEDFLERLERRVDQLEKHLDLEPPQPVLTPSSAISMAAGTEGAGDPFDEDNEPGERTP